MANFDNSSDVAMQLIRSLLLKRMKEKGLTYYSLAQLTGVNRLTLQRNLEGETEMSLRTYLKICGALELRPYLIPSENDDREMENRMFFN